MKMYRQGEVLLQQVKNLPQNAKKKDNVLARGEATGHRHMMRGQAQVFATEDAQYVQVEGESQLIHEEHKPITVEEGIYKVVIQREYDLLRDEVRKVMD